MSAATLTAEDRCDRCRAQAKVVVQMDAGELMFCQHHGIEYGFVEVLEQVRG